MSLRDPQDSSPFFQKLPTELRLDIYSRVFCSTRLSFGKQDTKKLENVRLRPAPNSLSLLRVCRRVNDEIGDKWLGQVLFSFADPETMLNKLTDLGSQTLGKLRHMRYTSEHPLTLQTIDDEEEGVYNWVCDLPAILKLLRGMRLDRLTVVGQPLPQCRYLELDSLINHSDGWKELYYVSHNSVMLGFGELDDEGYEWDLDLRAPQPSAWSNALKTRDGPTASVRIYRSKDAATRGSMISKPDTCQEFAGQVAEPEEESQYGVEPDAALMKPGEQEKEILVVARRGKDVAYTENGTSPMVQDDIREKWPGMTWGQIRYMCIDWFDEQLGRQCKIYDEDEDDNYEIWAVKRDMHVFFSSLQPALNQHDRLRHSDTAAGMEVDESGRPTKVDTYENVDDYEWGHYHRDIPPN